MKREGKNKFSLNFKVEVDDDVKIDDEEVQLTLEERLELVKRAMSAIKAPGQAALIAASLGLFHFARDCPNLYQLMAGERLNTEGQFARLDAAANEALQVFALGFAGTGMAPGIVVARTAIYVSALQGVVTQILHKRLRVAPTKTNAFVAEICKMLIKGIG